MTGVEAESLENSDTRIRRPRSSRKLEPVAIRLDSETLARVRELAREQGIGPTTLARMWILEHLRELKEGRPILKSGGSPED